jgi:hypothetical protein
MAEYEIVFPDDFADYEYEYEAKGYLTGARLLFGGLEAELAIYDPTRLAQEVDDEIGQVGYLACPNLLVVPEVSKKAISDAVARLSRGQFSEIAFS